MSALSTLLLLTSLAFGAECPKNAAEAKGSRCGIYPAGEGKTCKYKEGECWCGVDQGCSGSHDDPKPGDPLVWVCHFPPPKVRADGCPGHAPTAGRKCRRKGKVCRYEGCGVDEFTCKKGRWRQTLNETPG